MSGMQSVKMTNGHMWAIGSFVFSDSSIIIPTESINGMSDAEIGTCVRGLVDQAMLLNAKEVAEKALSDDVYLPPEDDARKTLNVLMPFAGKDYIVDEAIKFLNESLSQIEAYKRARDKRRSPDSRMRKEIVKRDANQCRYCGKRVEKVYIDHVVPYCMGGETTLDNLVCACFACNSKKHARTPEQAGMQLLGVPA